jgi:Skp family chaperone for outer membrane proteins
MTRLASRSPAAPFSTSRPAPMPQYPPQATKTTEAQTLRQMVQEREEEIQRLREELRDVRERLTHVDFKDLRRAQIDAKKIADNALDGGGDRS